MRRFCQAALALHGGLINAISTTDPEPLVGQRLAVLRGREFRLLFAGQALSTIGDRLFLVAMPFAVLSLPGAGAGDVGLVLGASALSLAVCVLIGGVVADRVPRQVTMLASDVFRALSQGATATLLLTGQATVWRLVALQAAYGAAEAFFRPALLGLVPQVVRAGQVQAANALLALSSNVSMVLAPAAAGILVVTVGPGATLVVDAATFVASAVSLLLMRPRATERSAKAHFLQDLAGGWREVTTRSWVWTTLIAFSAYHSLVLPALFVLGPQVAQDHRAGASSWGWISAGFGVGAVVGSLIALRWRPQRPGVLMGTTLCLASSQAALCASSLPTAVVAIGEAFTGVAVALCFTVWETALQERIPSAAQSRVSSFDYLGSLTLMPVGYLAVGPAADAFGVRTTAVGASVITGVICLAVASTRGLRELSHRADAGPVDVVLAAATREAPTPGR